MKTTYILLFCIALAVPMATGADKAAPAEPDYTKGGMLDTYHGRNCAALGPTGAHAWIWAQRSDQFTKDTRMLLIKAVDPGTPADGVLKEGDVILGIGDARFTSDARKALSAAITEAEKAENKGKLVLHIWRPAVGSEGKTMQVTLTLPVVGAYGINAPWNCSKTEAIVKAACDAIIKRGIDQKSGNQVASCTDALGLLATGDRQYWPLVRKYIDSLDAQSKAQNFEQQWTWGVAYSAVLLCEYHLLTDDKSVLPIIERYAKRIAMGRSGVGTWSHNFADPAQNGGKPFGMPASYGAMNQIGLTCALSLALAQKCGINDEHIESALKKSSAFISFYVDKGTIPYGDHDPNPLVHENNGVNSQAAVLFDLLGDKEAATYFTRMTLASHHERERGHTGHFFNWTWGAPGAARGGDEAAASFIRNTRWFTELERRPDGSFIYQFQLAGADHAKYRDWSTSGTRLLQYCLPRKQLHITGKGGGVVDPITGAELKEVVRAQELVPGERHSIDQLLEFLGHWSPRIRHLAAVELNKRDDDVVDRLIAMLDSQNRYARYGACAGLRHAGRGSEKAVRALVEKGLRADTSSMRYHAIHAFMVDPWWKNPDRNQGIVWENTLATVSHLAVPDLVKTALKDYPQEARPWTKAYVGYALFGNYSLRDRGPAGPGLLMQNKGAWEALDHEDRIKLVETLLYSEFGNVRSAVSFFYQQLSKMEIALLMPAIHDAVMYQAPSGVMFGGGVRLEGLRLLTQYKIKEGIDTGVEWTIRMPGWGNWYRKTRGLPVLAGYGGALKDHLPEIEETIKPLMESTRKKNPGDRHLKLLEESLRKIRTDPAPELISIEEFQKSVLNAPEKKK